MAGAASPAPRPATNVRLRIRIPPAFWRGACQTDGVRSRAQVRLHQQIVALRMEFLKAVRKLCYGLPCFGGARLLDVVEQGLGSPRRRCQGRVMRNQLCLSALACVLVVGLWPTLAAAQAAKTPPASAAPPVAVQPAATPDICYQAHGLTPKQ